MHNSALVEGQPWELAGEYDLLQVMWMTIFLCNNDQEEGPNPGDSWHVTDPDLCTYMYMCMYTCTCSFYARVAMF